MCVRVFWRSLCSKFFRLKDYFERFLCWLDHWLSCMLDCINICVFHILKNCFEKLARHLLDTSSIPCYLSSFSSIFLNAISTPPRYLVDQSRKLYLLDSSSTPAGSIELLFLNLTLCCSIPSRYLSCRRPDPQHLPRQLPWYLLIPQLSSITEGSIYFSIAILLSFLRSLSICPRLFISQTLSFSLQTSSSMFLQAFSSFSTFGKCLIPLYSCISCFKT